MNEKLEALNQEIEKTEKKLRRAQHEEKILEHQIKTLTRKERTHRLCTRAAMLESYLPHPEAITDEQVSLFLKLLFHKDSTRQLMEKVFGGICARWATGRICSGRHSTPMRPPSSSPPITTFPRKPSKMISLPP